MANNQNQKHIFGTLVSDGNPIPLWVTVSSHYKHHTCRSLLPHNEWQNYRIPLKKMEANETKILLEKKNYRIQYAT